MQFVIILSAPSRGPRDSPLASLGSRGCEVPAGWASRLWVCRWGCVCIGQKTQRPEKPCYDLSATRPEVPEKQREPWANPQPAEPAAYTCGWAASTGTRLQGQSQAIGRCPSRPPHPVPAGSGHLPSAAHVTGLTVTRQADGVSVSLWPSRQPEP